MRFQAIPAVLMLLVAGCMGGGSSDPPDTSDPDPGGGNKTVDPPDPGLQPPRYANLTDATSTSWQVFRAKATPEGSLAGFRSPIMTGEDGGTTAVVALFNASQSENVMEWGVMLFDMSNGAASLTGFQVEGTFMRADTMSTTAAWTPMREDFDNVLRVFTGSQHLISEPGHLGVVVFARSPQPFEFTVGISHQVFSDDNGARNDFAAEAEAGQAVRIDAETGSAYDLDVLWSDREDAGSACDADPAGGLLRWIGGPSLESAAGQDSCSIRQEIISEHMTSGWSWAIVDTSVVPGQRDAVLQFQGSEDTVTTYAVDSRSGQSIDGDPKNSPYLFRSGVGKGGSRVTSVETGYVRPVGSTAFSVHFATSADVGSWLEAPLADCLGAIATQDSVAPFQAPDRRSFCDGVSPTWRAIGDD